MPRFRLTFPLVLMLAPGVARAESQPALWRFAAPDAKVLIGIDWAHVRQSPAGAMLREKWIPKSTSSSFPALELLDSVDRILISSPGKFAPGEDPHADDPTDSSDTPILIAIHGHFGDAEVRELFQRTGAKRQSYESFQVYRPQSKKEQDMAFVLFDPETILYGFSPSVFAVLDHNRFAAAAPGADSSAGSLAARAATLESKYEIWAILNSDEALSGDGIANLFGAEAWATASQGFEAGLNLNSGLDADFVVHYASDVIAKRVTADLTHAVAMAARDKSVDAQAQNLAKKLKFSVDGASSRISLRLNEQDLEKAAQALTGAAKAGTLAAANPALTPHPTPVAPQVAAPAKPGVIRIEGLDDGPREIPYPDSQN